MCTHQQLYSVLYALYKLLLRAMLYIDVRLGCLYKPPWERLHKERYATNLSAQSYMLAGMRPRTVGSEEKSIHMD